MAIPPIGAAGVAMPTMPTMPTTSTVGTTGANGAAGAGGDFTQQVGQALDNLQATQTTADNLAQQAAVGALQDPSEYMIAATQASLETQLTVAVRDKAVEAFNSIMSMGV